MLYTYFLEVYILQVVTLDMLTNLYPAVMCQEGRGNS